MKAEEVLKKQKRLGLHDFYYEDEEIIVSMREYAKLKCQELLEIVAEKVKRKEVEIPSGLKIITTEIDKDSIINAVDLDSFIS